ncbi:MAG: efflux RND transporter periplasmic adaptor subunit [Acidobacteria bacterium]|nr:efflux RND transporter periplasmic adaptor subunit [Acidobacteriota bacterium]
MAKEQADLDDRLKSLRIDRSAEPTQRHGGGKPKLYLLIFSVLVVAAGFGAFHFFSGPKKVGAAEVKIEAADVQAGNTVLSVSGYVVAHHKIAVGSKVMGRVAWIGVEKGDKVIQDQVLVRLEDDEFRAQGNQARANVAAAQARLDQLRAGSRPEEKLQTLAAVRQAEASLKNAEQEYARMERLFGEKVASQADLDRALAQRDVARALLESARQASAIVEVGPRVEEIRAAEAQLQQMRAALDYAETQLASAEIRAPIAGTILQRMVERGEMVTPSAFGESGARTSVVALADLRDLQIELDISQTDFARLRMGQRAEIIPEAFPSLRYAGFVAEIAPEADRAKATVQVKVKVENPDEQLRPEMNARVNFLAEGKASGKPGAAALPLVPKEAVVRRDNNDFVFVIKGDRVEQRVIRRGLESGAFYYVLEGLSGGESVAVEGAEKLSDGDRVIVGM